MKTKMVFKMEKNPKGYNKTFAPDCKIVILNDMGHIFLDYDCRHTLGEYKNMRQDGETIVADVTLNETGEILQHRLDYGISAKVVANEKGECSLIEVYGLSALMLPND